MSSNSWLNQFLFIRGNRVHTGWIILLGLILLLLRAWNRLFYPEVWVEDGSRNILGFLRIGVFDLFESLNGYLVFIPKLITMLSVSLSFSLYPLISASLAWGFTLLVFVLIAKAPLHLKGGVLLAVTSMLIPSDPENFGLPLYTFWWAALLLFILIFWNENHPKLLMRLIIVFLASLSSPVCLPTLPLFWVRAVIFKNQSAELKLAIFASIFAAIQLWVMWLSHNNGTLVTASNQINFSSLLQIIPIFLGNYSVGNIFPHFKWVLGGLTLIYIFITLIQLRKSWVNWGLIYLWIVSVLMSITRVDINIIHPILAGPRYFFFPFIILSWLLLQFMFIGERLWIKATAGSLLLLGVVNAMPALDRKHDYLNWLSHVESCPQFEEYHIPIHYSGDSDRALTWSLPLTGKVCADLINKDPFNKHSIQKTYPYQVLKLSSDIIAKVNTPDISDIASNGWRGHDFYPPVSETITSPTHEIFLTSATDVGKLVLLMHQGNQIYYRSNAKARHQRIRIIGDSESRFYDKLPPSSEWIILDFSNRSLPNEFKVELIDDNSELTENSAIGLRNRLISRP